MPQPPRQRIHSSIFKEVLIESEQNQESLPGSYLKRKIGIPEDSKKAIILTGMRRSGKTTLMHQIQENLKKKRGKAFRSLHFHFFDERLRFLQASDLNSCVEAYYELHPEVSLKEKLYLFFDEIEMISGWELFIDRQLRNPHRKVFLTGSSSRLLGKEMATAMRGRSLAFEVFPFSFREILEWENFSLGLLTRIDRIKIKNRFQKYLIEGGFPEVVSPEHALVSVQKKILQEYYEVLLLRDLLERNEEKNIPLVRHFVHLLFQSFSSLVTLNKSHERLKSIGLKTDKTKLAEILKWVEDCYLLFPVSIYSESFSQQNINPKKIYAIDPGMIRALTTQVSENSGRLLENVIFLHFRRQGKKIHYYKTRSGFEIDFVIEGEKNKELYQVTETLIDPKTYERELRALEEGMEELGIQRSWIITQDFLPLNANREIKTRSGWVETVLASDFLLQE